MYLSFTHSYFLSTLRAKSELKVFLASPGLFSSIAFWLNLNRIKLNKNLITTTILLLTTTIAANIYGMHIYVPGTVLSTLHGIFSNAYKPPFEVQVHSLYFTYKETKAQKCLIVCP